MDFEKLNEVMIQEQIVARGVRHPKLLAAFGKVLRHHFVAPSVASYAYSDQALPHLENQTISQPFIIAAMCEKILEGDPSSPLKRDSVLEIGTGSGYQTAILAHLFKTVYTVELLPKLLEIAKKKIEEEQLDNVVFHCGDGVNGYPSAMPFDAIIVSCAALQIPETLVAQLGEGGNMVLPVGPRNGEQKLILLKKRNGVVDSSELFSVVFVPMMTGFFG